MKIPTLKILTCFGLLATSVQAAELTFVDRTHVSTNNANFDLSVFPGLAQYNDAGVGGSEPGTPTFTTTLGDGTLLDYNLVGNEVSGAPLVSYAEGGAGFTPTPTGGAVHGSGEDWANVWTVSDPGSDFLANPKDHNPTNVAGATNTFARAAEVDGTINISNLASGQVYIPHGTFNNAWDLTLTMSGPGQPDLVAMDSNTGIGNVNQGYISYFTFTNEGQYNLISYSYRHGDVVDNSPGSRARFMGVLLDGVVSVFDPDTDDDLLLDIWEDANFGNNDGIIENNDLNVSDGTGDFDDDDANDLQEQNAGSDPNVKDTDNDGLEDGPEINTHGSDPTLEDTDGDTLNDGDEVNTHGTDPTLEDTDGDTLRDDEELIEGADGFVTDPTLGDTDDDGVQDNVDTDPNDPDNDNDGDTIGNREERDVHGTNPLNDDSDGDTILDGEEVVAGEDGFITNPLATDTDGDGFNDAIEIGGGSDPTNQNSLPSGVSGLFFLERVLVSTNNANFDLSVFPGYAGYNDRGVGGTQPGTPTFFTPFGDGNVLDYNFVGNDGTGSELTTYADGGAGLIPTPTAPSANVHGTGEDWANVWTASDPGPDFLLNPKDHTPTNVAGAAETFARAANVTGTIDISDVDTGILYIPHGTFISNWTITLTMSGPDEPDIVATDTQGGDGSAPNNGWISSFTFVNTGGYDTITYTYTNTDADGSRARFMGVILAAESNPAPPVITDITFTRESAPDNILVALTFNSKEDSSYSVFTTTDLSLPIESWTEITDSFNGAAGSSLFTVNYNASALSLTDKQFFVVREN